MRRRRRAVQLELPVFGRRAARARGKAGTASKPGPKPRADRAGFVPHVVRPAHDARRPVHVTMKRVAAAPSLRAQRVFAAIVEELRAAVARGVRIVHFSVQGNHVSPDRRGGRPRAAGARDAAFLLACRVRREPRRAAQRQALSRSASSPRARDAHGGQTLRRLRDVQRSEAQPGRRAVAARQTPRAAGGRLVRRLLVVAVVRRVGSARAASAAAPSTRTRGSVSPRGTAHVACANGIQARRRADSVR